MKRMVGQRQEGAALLMVLWVLGILSFAVMAMGRLLDSLLAQEASSLASTRALLAAESGLEMMRNPALNPYNCGEATRQLNALLYGNKGQPAEGGTSFEVRVSREGAQLDLNWLATNPVLCSQILGRLFKVNWEISPPIADAAIGGLIDWVDPDDATQLNGAERRQYERLRRPGPRNAPLLTRKEFMLIQGWRELQGSIKDSIPSLAEKFTVGAGAKLDLSAADGDLIEAVLGLATGGADEWKKQRNGRDNLPLTADDLVDPVAAARMLGVTEEQLSERCTMQSRIRVVSTGRVGDTQRTIEAVLSEGSPRKIEGRWIP